MVDISIGSYDIDEARILQAEYFTVAQKHPYLRHFKWATESDTFVDLPEGTRVFHNHWQRQAMYSVDGLGEVMLNLTNDGSFNLYVAADNENAANVYYIEQLIKYPELKLQEGNRVPVSFWALGSHGPQQTVRGIEATSWEAIQSNYEDVIVKDMETLIKLTTSPANGKMLLWGGPPGTGKTWAIRSLIWEWRNWCKFHYITDPETFFGDRSSYMINVLLDEEDDAPVLPAEEEVRASAPEKWRVLLLEDTGELLTKNAKDRVGQGLSRLLNVVDGLIGQGLNVMVMITTNEELHSLHEAVQRPGRCGNLMKFSNLSTKKANDWLKEQGSELSVATPHSLAKLYALVGGEEVENDATFEAEKPRVGFQYL